MPPLAVTRSGTGAPLVLLHGLGSSRRAWDPVLPALDARFDVIAVDLPGERALAIKHQPAFVALEQRIWRLIEQEAKRTGMLTVA